MQEESIDAGNMNIEKYLEDNESRGMASLQLNIRMMHAKSNKEIRLAFFLLNIRRIPRQDVIVKYQETNATSFSAKSIILYEVDFVAI